MKHRAIRVVSFYLACLVCASLAGCQVMPQFKAVGILAAELPSGVSASLTVAGEQIAGYQRVEQADGFDLELKQASEGSLQDEAQVAFRSLVEESKVLAISGATSNEANMRAAALANFFNVPLVIPSSVADNLLPSNNLWAFRLSAPGAAHARYLFGQVLNKQALRALLAAGSPSFLKIAILYEQNTFGESAAVETAKAAMQQEVEIGLYASFDPVNPDPASLNEQADNIRLQQVDLVYLITSQASMAQRLVQAMQVQFTPDAMPVLLGQAGGFSALEFLQSPEAARVYVLQQQVNELNCPLDSASLTEAQAYAALYLIEYAVQESQPKVLEAPALKLPDSLTEKDLLTGRREAVRDVIKAANLDLPCLGKVSFDNTGQNKNVQFELIAVQDRAIQPVSPEVFLQALKNR